MRPPNGPLPRRLRYRLTVHERLLGRAQPPRQVALVKRKDQPREHLLEPRFAARRDVRREMTRVREVVPHFFVAHGATSSTSKSVRARFSHASSAAHASAGESKRCAHRTLVVQPCTRGSGPEPGYAYIPVDLERITQAMMRLLSFATHAPLSFPPSSSRYRFASARPLSLSASAARLALADS